LKPLNQMQLSEISVLLLPFHLKLQKYPYISVVNGYITDYFDPVDVMIPKDTRPFDHKVASIASKAIQQVQKRTLAAPFRAVAQKYGLKKLVSLYDFLTGDLTLIADLPEFLPLENLPRNFCYIGPLIWQGLNDTVPDYLKNLSSPKQPRNYVCDRGGMQVKDAIAQIEL